MSIFSVVLLYRCYRTSKSALRLQPFFYPVGSLDRTADLQVMALACESASLNVQRMATDA